MTSAHLHFRDSAEAPEDRAEIGSRRIEFGNGCPGGEATRAV
jgi:hypothetical protein